MLLSFMSLAANPVSPLKSHPCIFRSSNSPRIKSLRKNPRGRVSLPANPILNSALSADSVMKPSLGRRPPSEPKSHSSFITALAIGYTPPPTRCKNHHACISHHLNLLFSSAASPQLSPLVTPQLTQLADFPILLLQMNSRIHRHHHHHGTAPRLMRCV